MAKKTPTKQVPKKEEPKQLPPKAETPAEPELEESKPEQSISLIDLQAAVEALVKVVTEHTRQISELQETLARKRRPVASNGKVQIRDKQSGKVYPSKNNCYQSLLKAGELKDLVDAGTFGDNPEKNTFGWYALVRALPERFEEVVPEQAPANEKPK